MKAFHARMTRGQLANVALAVFLKHYSVNIWETSWDMWSSIIFSKSTFMKSISIRTSWKMTKNWAFRFEYTKSYQISWAILALSSWRDTRKVIFRIARISQWQPIIDCYVSFNIISVLLVCSCYSVTTLKMISSRKDQYFKSGLDKKADSKSITFGSWYYHLYNLICQGDIFVNICLPGVV